MLYTSSQSMYLVMLDYNSTDCLWYHLTLSLPTEREMMYVGAGPVLGRSIQPHLYTQPYDTYD